MSFSMLPLGAIGNIDQAPTSYRNSRIRRQKIGSLRVMKSFGLSPIEERVLHLVLERVSGHPEPVKKILIDTLTQDESRPVVDRLVKDGWLCELQIGFIPTLRAILADAQTRFPSVVGLLDATIDYASSLFHRGRDTFSIASLFEELQSRGAVGLERETVPGFALRCALFGLEPFIIVTNATALPFTLRISPKIQKVKNLNDVLSAQKAGKVNADAESLIDTQRQILNFVVEQIATGTSGRSVTGKLIRARLRVSTEEIQSLRPRYLKSYYDAPSDQYEATLDGLLASTKGDATRSVLQAVLRTFIAKFGEQPDFVQFSWPEVRKHAGHEISDSELQFFDLVMKVAKLCESSGTETGTPTVWIWYVPRHVEQLITKAGPTGEVPDFIDAINAYLARPTAMSSAAQSFDISALTGRRQEVATPGPVQQLLVELDQNYSMSTALRAILRRDAQELERVRSAGGDKSVLLISGGILEGVLIDVISKRPDLAQPLFEKVKKGNRRFPDEAGLRDLLDLATSAELAPNCGPLLSDQVSKLGESVIDHRDLIHPHREVRAAGGLPIDKYTADALYNVLCLVLRDVANAAKNGWVRRYE